MSTFTHSRPRLSTDALASCQLLAQRFTNHRAAAFQAHETLAVALVAQYDAAMACYLTAVEDGADLFNDRGAFDPSEYEQAQENVQVRIEAASDLMDALMSLAQVHGLSGRLTR